MDQNLIDPCRVRPKVSFTQYYFIIYTSLILDIGLFLIILVCFTLLATKFYFCQMCIYSPILHFTQIKKYILNEFEKIKLRKNINYAIPYKIEYRLYSNRSNYKIILVWIYEA